MKHEDSPSDPQRDGELVPDENFRLSDTKSITDSRGGSEVPGAVSADSETATNAIRGSHFRRLPAKWQCSEKAFRRRVMKNVYVSSCSMSLALTALMALVNLQSSIFVDQGLGVVCQAIGHGMVAATSLFLPKVLLTEFGHKWTMVVALYGYAIWISANGYANWLTMITASVISGCGSSLLWTTFGSYITVLASQYAIRTKKDIAGTISLFFGIGFGIVKTSRLLASVLIWSILRQGVHNSSLITEDDLRFCGRNDCPWLNTGNVFYGIPPKRVLWMFVGVCLAFGLLAILFTSVLMDELPEVWLTPPGKGTKKTSTTILDTLLAASRLHRNIKQLLVIPAIVYGGLSISFIQADLNKSYITCALGISTVGVVLIPYAIITAVTALVSGRIGRGFAQFVFGFLVDVGLFVTCLLWKPRPEVVATFFIISGLFGVTSAIWHTQTNVLCGGLFNDKEAVMANYTFWQSIGFAVMFGMSRGVCVDVKIYILLSVLTLTIICLAVLQIILKREAKAKKADWTTSEKEVTKNVST